MERPRRTPKLDRSTPAETHTPMPRLGDTNRRDLHPAYRREHRPHLPPSASQDSERSDNSDYSDDGFSPDLWFQRRQNNFPHIYFRALCISVEICTRSWGGSQEPIPMSVYIVVCFRFSGVRLCGVVVRHRDAGQDVTESRNTVCMERETILR